MNKHWIWILLMVVSAPHEVRAQEEVLPQPYIDHADNGLIYNTVFHYKDFSLSGLMVLKKVAGDYHVVLLSKVGMTMMEFVLTEEGLVWKKLPQGIKKRLIEKVLVSDFRLLLLTPLDDPHKVKKRRSAYKVKNENKIKVWLNASDDRVLQARNKRILPFFKSKVIFYYTDDDYFPDDICLTRNNIRMKMEMNLIKK